MKNFLKEKINNYLLLTALCLPVTIACIDLMALSVAIDKIKNELQASITLIQWLLSGYTIGTGIFLIAIGKLADKYGRKKLLLVGITLFGLASLIASLSSSVLILIESRFLQGVASSIMMITVISIITNSFEESSRGKIIGTWGLCLGLGLSIGPLVGSLLIHFSSWRAIFLINIPIAILAFYLVFQYVSESKSEKELQIDWIAVFLFSSIMFLMIFILSEGAAFEWNSKFIISLTVLFFLLSAIYFFYEKHFNMPLIDFSLFKIPNFFFANGCGGISYFCMYGWLFFISFYLENIYKISPVKTGLLLSSYSVAFGLNSYFAGKLINKYGNRKLIQIGFSFVIFSFILMCFIGNKTSISEFLFMFSVFGASLSLINAPSMTSAIQKIPSEKAATASGMIFTLRWICGTLGIAIVTLLYLYFHNIHLIFFILTLISSLGFYFSNRLITLI